MFVVSIIYKKLLPEINLHLPEYVEFLNREDAKGSFAFEALKKVGVAVSNFLNLNESI